MVNPHDASWDERLAAVFAAAGHLRGSMIDLAGAGLAGAGALAAEGRRLAASDREAASHLIADAAHKLANTCAALRLGEELTVARDIEREARDGTLESAIDTWCALSPRIDDLRSYLEAQRAVPDTADGSP